MSCTILCLHLLMLIFVIRFFVKIENKNFLSEFFNFLG